MGLGRLVSLPFAGPLSDKLERRISVLIGAASYVIFFIGIAFSPNIQADYVGKVIPDEFVIGYGLDYNEKYRNLPYVGVLSPKVYADK